MLRCFSPLLVLAGLCTPLQLHASSFEGLFAAIDFLESEASANQPLEQPQIVDPAITIYGDVYFSLSMAENVHSNIPRFMTYLMIRYQGRKETEKTPDLPTVSWRRS